MQAINQMLLRGVGALSAPPYWRQVSSVVRRLIPSFNGIDQYGLFAQLIVGDGMGELVLQGKVSDQDKLVKLLDGETSNRFYCNLGAGEGLGVPVGTAISVEGGTSLTGLFNKVVNIEITGDFTNLEISTLFARNNLIEFAEIQPLSLTYKDQAQSFQLGFDTGKDFEVIGAYSRDLVTQNKTSTWDGTEANWSGQLLGFEGKAGKVYWCKLKPSTGATGQLKAQAGQMNGQWGQFYDMSNGPVEFVYVPDADNYFEVQTPSGADKFVGTVEAEIREIDNALMFPNGVDWAKYVQQPDGDWMSKVAIKPIASGIQPPVLSGNDILWDRTNYGEVVYRLPAGEVVQFKYSHDGTNAGDHFGDNDGATWPNIIQDNEPAGTYTKSYVVATNDDLRLYAKSYGPGKSGFLLRNVSSHHLITLSDYQRKQHYIKQAKAAIEKYQAQQRSGYVVTTDGIDDWLDLSRQITLSGAFSYKLRGIFDAGGFYLAGTKDTSDGRMLVTADGNFFYANSEFLGLGDTSWMGDDAVHEIEVTRDHNDRLAFSVDGDELNSVVSSQPITFDSFFCQYGGATSIPHFSGQAFWVSLIDHENPVPAGHGGNSGFWPLDDADDVARNVLGLDSRGNIVAQRGAGLGDELVVNGSNLVNADHWIPVNSQLSVVDGSLVVDDDGIYSTAYQAVPTVVGRTYILEVVRESIEGQTESDVAFGNSVPAGAGYGDNTSTLSSDGAFLRGFKATASTTYISVCSRGASKAIYSKVSLRDARGSGQWQGNPARQLFSLDRKSGSLLGPNIMTQDVWENPSSAQDQWSFAGDMWSLDGDGSLNAITFIPTVHQPARWKLAGEVVEFSGTPLRTVANAIGADVSAAGSYEFSVKKSDAGLMQFKRSTGVTKAVLKKPDWQEELPLSPELQRQHDLKLIQEKIARLDRLYSRNMPIINLDGIDDSGSVQAWTAAGAFEIRQAFQPTKNDYHDGHRLLGTATVDDCFAKLFDSGVFRLRVGDSNKDLDISSVLSRELFQIVAYGRDDDGLLYIRLHDGVKRVISAGVVTGDVIVESLWSADSHQNTDAYAGSVVMIDYAQPLRSRYYIPAAAGFKDLLGDGSTDGVYQGDPVPPVTFRKVGDDWVSPSVDFQVLGYGSGADYIRTEEGQRVTVSRTDTLSGWVGFRFGGLQPEADYIVEFDEIQNVGQWQIRQNSADSLSVIPLEATQVVKSDASGRINIEERSPALGEVLDGTYTVKRIIKGA